PSISQARPRASLPGHWRDSPRKAAGAEPRSTLADYSGTWTLYRRGDLWGHRKRQDDLLHGAVCLPVARLWRSGGAHWRASFGGKRRLLPSRKEFLGGARAR